MLNCKVNIAKLCEGFGEKRIKLECNEVIILSSVTFEGINSWLAVWTGELWLCILCALKPCLDVQIFYTCHCSIEHCKN